MSLDERLELDIADALRGIDSIESALGSAASSFQSALTDALDVLSSVTVGEVDASAVTSGIDEAVAAADVAPVIDADASSVTDTIDEALAAADDIVTVDADTTSIVSEVEDAISSADTTIEVDADTTAASAAVDELGSSAGGATDGVGGLAQATAGLDAAAGAALGNVSGLEGAASSMGPEAKAGAAGVAALAGTVTGLFKAAVDSESAQRRLNAVTGEFAAEVQRVDVGGLNEDLTELAQRTGQDDEALKLAAARFFDLGKNAGVAGPEIATSTKQLEGISIALATANPSLGQAGDVANRLTTAFARGGRALAPYGIALSATDITQRAVADSGGKAADQLTIFEKAQAGLNITMERTPDLLNKIAEATKNPQIQVQIFQETFKNALEEIGQPLIVPVLDVLKAGLPVGVELAQVMASLGTIALPAVEAALNRIVGPLHLVNQGLEAITATVDGLDSALPGLGGNLLDVVGAVADPLSFIAGQVSDQIDELTGNSSEAEAAEKAHADAVLKLTSAYEDLNTPIATTNASFIEEKIKAEDLVGTLAKLGITYDQLSTFASHGKVGVKELDDAITASGNKSKVSGDDIGKLRDVVRGAGEDFQKSARGALDDAVANGEVTKAARDAAVAKHELAGGGRDYLAALNELLPAQGKDAQANKDAASATSAHDQAVKDLNKSLNDLLATELASIDKGLALEVAQTRSKESVLALKDAEKELADKQRDSTTSADELEKAHLRVDSASQAVKQSALAVAQAHLEAAAAARGLSVDQLDASEKAHILIASLSETAGTLAPDSPLRANLVQYVSELLGIPPEQATLILADPSQANDAIDQLQGRLQGLATGRTIVHIGADVAAAVLGGNMAGGPVSAGVPTFVGEVEPEIFVPRTAGVIGNQAQLQAAFSTEIARQLGQLSVSGGTGAQVGPIIVNEVANDPRATANAVAFRLGEAVPR